MFDVDEFLNDCVGAGAEREPRLAIRDALVRALGRPGEIGDALRPAQGGLTMLHNAPDLTVAHVVWAPGMQLFPHDHRMWAVIGVYAGREDNSFFRRAADDRSRLVESGGKELAVGDVLVLGDDTIHAVANPTDRLTSAIHVYGGDFVHQARSQWGPGERVERPFVMEELERQFADANRVAALNPAPERVDPSG